MREIGRGWLFGFGFVLAVLPVIAVARPVIYWFARGLVQHVTGV